MGLYIPNLMVYCYAGLKEKGTKNRGLPKTMGGKEMISFLFIAGFLLSVNAQHTMDAPVETAVEVQITSVVETSSYNCSQVNGVADLNRFLAEGFADKNLCVYSLLQYSCADVTVASAETWATVLKCYLADQNAILSQDALDKIILNLGPDKFRETLHIFHSQVSISSVTRAAKSLVLSATWKMLSSNPSILTPGVVAAWFQERLFGYLDDTAPEIINSMTHLPLGCDSFEAFVGALNIAYATYTTETRQLIGAAITRYLQAHSCRKAAVGEFIRFLYGQYINDINFSDLQLAWSGIDVSGSLSSLTSFQVVQYAISSNAFSSAASSAAILQFLQGQTFSYIADFAESISLLSGSSASFDHGALYSLLTLALDKFNTDDGRLCKSSLKVVFSTKLKTLLTTIDGAALSRLPANMDCSEYQDIFYGINLVYSQLDATNQLAVFNYRYAFMLKEAEKTGSACACDHASQEWLEVNFGYSLNFLTFAQILHLNPSFDAFTSLSILTLNQTIDALIHHEIFTGVTVEDYESRVSAVTDVLQTRGFDYLEEFFISLNTVVQRDNIVVVVNEEVRSFFLDNTWEIFSSHFSSFHSEEWTRWFQEYLSIFLPSIREQHLQTLTWEVIGDCSTLHIIVQGFDDGYGYMSEETKQNIIDWIVSILRQHSCDHDDWINYNFYSFKELLTVTIIKELNPTYDLIAHLDEFTVTQITQCVFYEESAQTEVSVISQVFDAIISDYSHVEVIERLDVYWTEFNTVITEEVTFVYEVEYTMLVRTTSQLEYFYSSYTEVEFGSWFETNLHQVLHTINSTIIEQIPVTISCSSYEKLSSALNSVYEKTKEDNREDVYGYYNKYLRQDDDCVKSSQSLVTILGEYSEWATYTEYVEYYSEFNILETGVISTLTTIQIGDAIAQSDITTSVESVNQLFVYLDTRTVEEVDTCFTQFTKTAVTTNLQITNEEAGSALLNNYLQIVQTEIRTYTAEQYETFFSERIFVLIRFINTESLTLLYTSDCSGLSIFVEHLSTNYNYFSDDIIKQIIDWILSYLKSQSLGGCTEGAEGQNSRTWAKSNLGSFFPKTKLKDIIHIKTDFDITVLFDLASVNQKVDYVTTSDALTNATLMQPVLESFNIGDSVPISTTREFLLTFNEAYSQLSNQNIAVEVQQEIMSFFFSSWVQNINSVTEEQRSEFGTWFQYVTGGTDVALVEQIPDTMDCNTYGYVISAFNTAFGHLEEEVKQSIADYILKFANEKQKHSPGNVCSESYTDSRTYVEHFVYQFSEYNSFDIWDNYYDKFDVYEILDLCTSTQLAEVFFSTNAYQDEFEAVQILVEVKKRTVEEVTEFATKVTEVAEQLHITSLESNIESLVFETLYAELIQSTTTTSSAEVFSQLTFVLSGITTQQIEEIRFTSNCSEQTTIVQSFESVIEELSEEKKKAFSVKLYENLSIIKKSTGSACETGKTDAEWIGEVIGGFAEYFEVTQFTALNAQFNVLEAASELTATQLATYLYTSSSLESETAITTVFESFGSISEVHECITQLNIQAAEELRSSSQASLILELTFEQISGSFHEFRTEQWSDWFGITLVNLLHAVNTSQLETFHLPLSCEYYHEVLKGFDKSYEFMTEETRRIVYDNFIRKQLDSIKHNNGPSCGDATMTTQEWLDINLAQYTHYAEFTSLYSWNAAFSVSEVVSSLSVEQLAEVILHESNINNEELACQVAGRIQQSSTTEINSFLFQITTVSQQSGVTEFSNKIIERKLLGSVINGMKSHFRAFNKAVWSGFIGSIQIFFGSIDKEILTSLLDGSTCDNYPIIVSSLSGVYDSYSAENQEIFYELLYGFLENTAKGSACTVSDESSSDWLGRVFSKFSRSATLTKIKAINSNFNGLQAISVLTATQVGELVFSGDVLTNRESANIVIDALQGYSYDQVSAFLGSINAQASQRGFTSLESNDITSSIADTIFSKVALQFSSFTDSQTIDFWSIQYNLFARSINAAQIRQISHNNLGCNAYQSIISTLSKYYASLSGDTQEAGYAFGKDYLLAQKQKTGSACTPQISGNAAILQVNFGAFLPSASYQELVDIFGEFIVNDALASLNEKQLAYSAVLTDGLTDLDKMKRIMTRVGSLNGDLFMSYLNQAAEEKGITQLSNSKVKHYILGELLCKVSGKFPLFSPAQYSSTFGSNYKLLLGALNAKTLGFLPTDMSCESLSSITQILINYQNLENPEDVYNFIDSVLQQQLKTSGSACTNGLSSREWILKFYGVQFSKYAEWKTLSTLNSHIVVNEVTDLLSETQLASASVSSTVITSVSSVSNFFISFPSDPNYFIKFLENLRLQYLQNTGLFSNKVRETILYKASEIVFPTVATMTLSEWEGFLGTLDFLLATVNSSITDHLSQDIPCSHYQAFIKALDNIYAGFSQAKKEAIYQYAKSYLSYQASTNGDACAPASGDTYDFVNQNLKRFCKQSAVSDIQNLYPEVDPVSYNRMCYLES